MSNDCRLQRSTPTPAQVAEAAAWISHLHGAQRSADSDRGLQLWLKEDPSHVRAWEVATEVWDETGNLQGAAAAQTVQRPRRDVAERRHSRVWALAAAVAVAVFGMAFYMHDAGVATGVGEQRTVTLEDGSRVTLNTDTRLVVRYDAQRRRIELKSGEALFEVAKRPQWPFIVSAQGREIHALGTAFVVRTDKRQLAVTLVEGKVAVTQPQAADSGGTAAATNVLAPGERLTFVEHRSASIDRPALDKVTAWQYGKVVLDGTSLREAIAEMNRYSRVKLSVEQSQAEALRISGVFRAGDALSFANAVAATYRLQVVEMQDRIVMAGRPEAAYR